MALWQCRELAEIQSGSGSGCRIEMATWCHLDSEQKFISFTTGQMELRMETTTSKIWNYLLVFFMWWPRKWMKRIPPMQAEQERQVLDMYKKVSVDRLHVRLVKVLVTFLMPALRPTGADLSLDRGLNIFIKTSLYRLHVAVMRSEFT